MVEFSVCYIQDTYCMDRLKKLSIVLVFFTQKCQFDLVKIKFDINQSVNFKKYFYLQFICYLAYVTRLNISNVAVCSKYLSSLKLRHVLYTHT